MLRFRPDHLLEGIARPFLMGDAAAGLYFESSAPDWRFAAFIVLLGIGLIWGTARQALRANQAITIGGLLGLMMVWTFAIGNGRYFAWGLLLIGPLLVLACRLLPGSRGLRWAALALVVAVQALAVQFSFHRHSWVMVEVVDEPLRVDPHPLREKPAVFMTLTANTYSLLIPSFHPESRWISIGGQRNIAPGSMQDKGLQELIKGPLPLYLFAPTVTDSMSADGQPLSAVRGVMDGVLNRYGLITDHTRLCERVRAAFANVVGTRTPGSPTHTEFWACPVHVAATHAPTAEDQAMQAVKQRNARVFAQVELLCPRFFPAHDAQDTLAWGMPARYYVSSDMRVMIHPSGQVIYKYFRAYNPTLIGSVDEVLAGRGKVDCLNIPGRYQLPWNRD